MKRFVLMSFVALVALGCQSTRTTPAVEAAPEGSIPVVGQSAPPFRLLSNEGTETGLEEMLGKWVVLYFYPKDFTGGCTAEARNFQRDIERFESLGAVILGVSVDSVESHKEFCTQEGLTFRLLADTDGVVSTRYGSLNIRSGNRSSARNTFVIDPLGRIARVFTGVNPAAHSADVLAALEELQAG